MTHLIGNLVKQVRTGIILHQVNCQGVMGSGIAKELRETYPVVWREYKDLCDRAPATIELLGMAQLVKVNDDLYVANLFGQHDYGRSGERYTSYDALDNALRDLVDQIFDKGLQDMPVHHPLLGCGLGGGHWNVVEALIVQHIGVHTTLWTLD